MSLRGVRRRGNLITTSVILILFYVIPAKEGIQSFFYIKDRSLMHLRIGPGLYL